MSAHCCEMMRSNVENICDRHSDRRDCPDALVDFSERTGFYGLFIRDGEDGRAESNIVISYCPWCGTKFAKGLVDL